MAAQKRKSELAAERRPEKKQKAVQPPTEHKAHTTVLRDEEEAFPRGGSNVLTPLEKRQIQIKAREDVLFEQSTGKKARNDYGSDSDDDDDDDGDLPEESSGLADSRRKEKNKKSKSAKTNKKDANGGKSSSSGLRIESLSYKRLVPGSIVLGQVASINQYDVTISLPNSLTGYVPLTSISDRVTRNIEEIAAQEDSDGEEAEDDGEAKELRLQDYLTVGQYVRAYVSAIGVQDQDGSTQNSKRHVTLSLHPEQVNGSLSESDVCTNNVVQAAVESVEDHGLVMNVGLSDSSMKAFLGSRELPSTWKLSNIKPGAIMLCLVTGLSSNGKIVKLSASELKLGQLKKGGFLQDAPSVDAFQPGCAVEVMISAHSANGVTGKVMGLLDATADALHCAAYSNSSSPSLEKRFPVGSKVKARVICTFPTSDQRKVGVSFLPHLLSLTLQKPSGSEKLAKEALPVSTVVKAAKVVAVEPNNGVYLDVGIKGLQGFAHISRLSDDKVNDLTEDSGPFKKGSTHEARVVGYNPVDGLFIMSLEASVIEMPYLNIEDINPGDIVKATVEKLIVNAAASTSIILRLTRYIDGLVPEMHLSDVQLQNPEKKFKVGTKVTARVLSIDLGRRRLRLTLKKSLVNSESPVWLSYDAVSVGSQAPGTIVNITSAGAVVQYYGSVRGFLPVAQMSETFIKDPRLHFRVGQVISTHVLSVDPQENRMTVSCRDPSSFGPKQQQAYDELKILSLTSGLVSEKTNDEIVLEIGEAKIKAVLPVDQLADGSAQKCQHAAKRIRVGQILQDLLILQKFDTRHTIQVSNKPALVKAERAGALPKSLDDLDVGKEVIGFVRNVTTTAVYIQFAADLVGLLPRAHIAESALELPAFGLRKHATITCRVLSIDTEQNRFVLTQRDIDEANDLQSNKGRAPAKFSESSNTKNSHTIDPNFVVGNVVEAKVNSVKECQLNVSLAEGVQGRIDVSQIFDVWDEIKDRKKPLNHFKAGETLKARIIGIHNHRNHKFLPISHAGKAHVYELTAKKSDLIQTSVETLALDKLKEGDEYLCFVNNISSDCLWVNLSPSVRGRIRAIDASDDTSILSNLGENFPPGSAVRARVIHIDVKNGHLDLSARTGSREAPKTFSDVKVGSVLPGKVTRVSERQVMVQLSDAISGPVHLVEMADDFAKANPTDFERNQIIRVHVTGVDVPNKKLVLSTRPSKVLSSSLPVTDKEVRSVKQLHINDVLRGFIKNVADNGIFVALSSVVTAFVRVADLSDLFIKDWKAEYEIDRLVQGKVISVDPDANHVQLSLKRSVVENKDYQPPVTYTGLKVGQVVTGKVRKVEDFGVFIAVDNSANVSGLCHRSEIADETVPDVKALFNQGDLVKAKVLKVDLEKRRVAFGLKASYFKEEVDGMEVDENSNSEDEDISDGLNGVYLGDVEAEASEEEVENLDSDQDQDPDIDSEDSDAEVSGQRSNGFGAASAFKQSVSASQGLNVGGFDWDGKLAENDASGSDSGDMEAEAPKPARRKKAEIQIDRTADLDVNGPQSTADFERLLMSEPNSSYLWLSYMAHYLQLNEVGKAREIAERATKTVNHQASNTQEDALNVWVGYLNLENTYGTEETTTELFDRAVQYNDSEEIHSRLASIYIQSKKTGLADDLLQSMVKKFSQDPKIWLNYADFLFDTLNEPVRGRDLLPRALQALPQHQHLDLTTKFAQLEFKSANGDAERGRTMFEGLIDTYPKRLDLYNVLLDLEQKSDDVERVRRLYQRATSGKLKAKQAKFFFKRWLEFEQSKGDAKSVGKVKARAEEFVRKHKEANE